MEIVRSSSHVVIYTEHLTPRVDYIFRLLLEENLGLDVQLQRWEGGEAPAGAFWYGYVASCPAPNLQVLPCEGLLFEADIRRQNLQFLDDLSLESLEGDLFALAFVFLTQYEFHARLQVAASPFDELDGHGRPVQRRVHTLVHDILDRLRESMGEGPQVPAFDYEITLDIDNPWKYLHKPAVKRYGGLVKDLLKLNFSGFQERISTLMTGKDPFDVEVLVRQLCPPSKTSVFVLSDGQHPHDSSFDLRMPAFQKYVNQYRHSGFQMGIHPSYETYLDLDKTAREKELLESIVGKVDRSRQHFLRYANPKTWNHLMELGIEREYSLCPLESVGSEVGFLRPFPWFDLVRNEASPLRLVPACMMDRGLMQYMGLKPEAALELILEWIGRLRVLQGYFVIILHNETFSDSGEWKGWRRVIMQMMEELRKSES